MFLRCKHDINFQSAFKFAHFALICVEIHVILPVCRSQDNKCGINSPYWYSHDELELACKYYGGLHRGISQKQIKVKNVICIQKDCLH